MLGDFTRCQAYVAAGPPPKKECKILPGPKDFRVMAARDTEEDRTKAAYLYRFLKDEMWDDLSWKEQKETLALGERTGLE